MDIFWSLYLAQIGAGATIIGTIAFLMLGIGAICTAMMESMGDLPRGVTRKVIKAAIASIVLLAAGMTVPTHQTIIWSAGIEHGPEYVERLISSMGQDK